MKTTDPRDIIQLKISLAGAKPQIWRRIEIPGECTLGDLHEAIQTLFEWANAHLHEFDVNKQRFAVVYEAFGESDAEDADDVQLKDLSLQKGSRFLYTYDFGDNWEHVIEVEAYLPRRKDREYPRCVKAVRAAPPEDSGGISGYQRLLRIYKNPSHSEHEDVCDWLGEDFDPAEVDEQELTEELVVGLGDS